jgi:hypothetical protein
MLITSMGIFGFLSKAHLDQNIVSGDSQARLSLLDEKIRTQRDNIDVARKALQQMDAQVDARLSRGDSEQGAERAVQIRRQQASERTKLQREIGDAQKEIAKLNEERAPIAAENRKIEAEVGPIKYIAKLIYGDNPDTNILEKAVTWVIILIIFVFDPLAVLMLLASQWTFAYLKNKPQYPQDDGPLTNEQLTQLKQTEPVYPWPFPVAVPPIETQNPDHVDYDYVGVEDVKPDSWVADVGDKPTAEELAQIGPAPEILPPDDAIYDWDGSNKIYSRSYIDSLIEKLARQEIKIDHLNQEELNEINSALHEQSEKSSSSNNAA